VASVGHLVAIPGKKHVPFGPSPEMPSLPRRVRIPLNIGDKPGWPFTASFGRQAAFRFARSRKAKSGDLYSITLSARNRTDGGILTPNACAVFRLTTNSNSSDRSIGRFAGFVPLAILST